jgi:hypothetical protein
MNPLRASEDTGIAADPTVVLAEANIADIVQPVFDIPFIMPLMI